LAAARQAAEGETVSEQKLVLHPVNPWAILQDPTLLTDSLRDLGLLGLSFGHFGELHYKAGPRFRELVVFKTAAPSAPSPDPAFHISLLETTADAAFLGGANAQPPQCPECHAPHSDWRMELQAWQRDRRGHLWACRKCGQKVQVHQLDWLRTAGVARYSLDVWGIGAGEAVPSDELLGFLEGQTFEKWTYFYYRL
jgi:hypothetical protein